MITKKFISSSFSIKHPRNTLIRRQSNLIEDIFEDRYFTPNVISVPDEIEPNMPRIILSSKNGHSQILFSQTSIDFNVNYTGDYIYDFSLCENYLRERIHVILRTLNELGIKSVLYFGLVCQTNIPYELSEDEIIQELLNKFSNSKIIDSKVYDFINRIALVDKEKYFINLNIGNYRQFDINANIGIPELMSFEKAKINEHGIFVNSDVNCRYLFNKTGNPLVESEILKEADYIIEKSAEINKYKLGDIIEKGVIRL